MRTIETIVYKFDELSESSKQTALDKFSLINVEFGEWWDFDHWKEDLETIGCCGIEKNVYFDIDRGSFFSFDADLRGKKMIETYEALPDDYSGLPPSLFPILDQIGTAILQLHPLVKKLILSGEIESMATARHGNWDINTDCEHNIYESNWPNIFANIDPFTDELEDILKEMSNLFLKRMRDEYEYQTSEAAILEAIEANEYEFTEDGKLA